MLVDVSGFGQRCNFSTEAIYALQQAVVCLEQHDAARFAFETGREQLFAETGDPWALMNTLAEESGIHQFVIHQLFLIFCAEETYSRYQQAGYSEELYWDAVKDLKYKMEVTWEMYGIWGTYCGPWLASFLLMKSFCLGRLQFEILPSEFHYEMAGHTLKPHDLVVNVHIPSFGRLDHDDVLDAYARAAKFFGHLFPDGVVWFHCETWMLYPQVLALIPPGNMRRFAADYDIVHAFIDPLQDDRFRVFPVPPHVSVSDYPETNTLQRRLKAWLLEGNTMGVGFGLFLWKNGGVIPHG